MLRICSRRPSAPFKPACLGGAVETHLARQSHAAAESSTQATDIPAGHRNSDLGSSACNIGLNRRRDLSLRTDIKLFTSEKELSLQDVFRGKMVVLFGLPDMGRVCAEKHAPSFKAKADELKQKGIDKVYCLAVSEPSKLEEWGRQQGFASSNIDVLADKAAAFARLIGVDLEAPESPGPHTQRYAALVEDGILLKLCVEDSPGEVRRADAQAILNKLNMLQSLKGSA